jgi:GMP synthase-like glutamine amidotransferase
VSARVLVVEHEAGTHAGYLGEQLVASGLLLDVRRPYLAEPLPGSLADHDALLVLGGSPDPYDATATPWLEPVRALMGEALDRELPTLGICLGGEILAMVAGGQVRPATHAVEVGVYELTATAEGTADPLFGGLPQRFPAVEWHVEEIAALPPGSVLLCSSPSFANQAFRVGPCAWGTQFHPEVLSSLAEAWATEDSPEMARAGVTRESVVAGVRAEEERLREVWGGFADRWAGLVLERARAAASG